MLGHGKIVVAAVVVCDFGTHSCLNFFPDRVSNRRLWYAVTGQPADHFEVVFWSSMCCLQRQLLLLRREGGDVILVLKGVMNLEGVKEARRI
jgi:hypothetical protein